uniref:Pre-mRNA-splicing factor CWC25 isoform X2 n=1 Tax=Elaeis guineensis var. tenera TaxID=51953 RepID=A0A8N4IEW1_ELAGV|nr:pre-mRNA-splicing factor CWC25 isoform X2 [Elaeis guineensis]
MSSAPKKLHEEGGHSTPLKRPLEDTSIYSSPGKLVQPVGNDFYLPIERGQDGRFSKVPRIEPRDIDKRSHLLHRMPSASNGSLDHPVTSENKLEFENSKDAREGKIENWETKAEVRDLYTDTRMDLQDSKAENASTIESRGDEKELKSDRGSHIEYKGDIKFNKDNYTSTSSHLNWKDNKENQKDKRYFESPNDGLDSWHVARSELQCTDEAAKDVTAREERHAMETHEAVEEDKTDLKGEEKFRDKDRKRKDDKHRDYGERDKDRNDRRNSLQHGGASIECIEVLREERDMESWERERKGTQKDMERNDREKDIMERNENANAKEDLHCEKEFVDGSIKVSEPENTTIESKRLKVDSWKSYDRDFKERQRERDADAVDSHEQHDRCYDKESDDGCAEGEGATEKDKDVFGGVQQRRKMLRSMGTPQAPHLEPRFRSRARDERSQGKPEVSAVVYKAGECMQELRKSWKEFQASQHTKRDESLQNGPTLEIRIPAEYVTSTNHQVKGAQLWGTDTYTNDSDLVAVLMHTGYCCPTSSPPPPTIQELWATVRILPPQDGYTSTLRNNVRSRAWGAGIGCSFRVERCCVVKKGGGTIDLEPHLTHTSAVEPTLAPISVERTMTTRAAASNALRQQRFVREVTIQYNLCNEPWLKYSISVVADKGLKKPLYTSARLKKGEVLYLETHFSRVQVRA